MPREGGDAKADTKAPAKHYEVKGAAPLDPKSKEKLKLEDSNLANYGSKEHKDLKLKVAKTEEAWRGAGVKVGKQVWRVEKFEIKAWPIEKYGSFFDGDAYIVLNTYYAKTPEGKVTDKLAYNVHFWLGRGSSQDERGTAAYKTVELDDLLGDLPVQFREVQGRESKEFLAVFGAINVMSGGIESGFNIVKPTEYKSKLLQVNGVSAKYVRVDEVKLDRSSLNNGDVFVLDAGLSLYQWNGSGAALFEKRKANEVINQLFEERNGRPTKTVLESKDTDEKFWAHLGGFTAVPELKAGPAADKVGVNSAAPDEEGESWSPLCTKEVWRVDVAPGAAKATFTNVVAPGSPVLQRVFQTDGVYILAICDDTKDNHVYVWVGNNTSKTHKGLALLFGQEFCDEQKLSEAGKEPSIVRVIEGSPDYGFNVAIDDAPRAAAPAKAAAAAAPAAAGAGAGASTVAGRAPAPADAAAPLEPHLLFTAVKATNLTNLDRVGKSDPYVKVCLYDAKTDPHLLESKKTKVIKDELNPTWNDTLDFSSYVRSHPGVVKRLRVQVWDEDIGKDELIGEAFIDLPAAAGVHESSGSSVVLKGGLKKPDNGGVLEYNLRYVH